MCYYLLKYVTLIWYAFGDAFIHSPLLDTSVLSIGFSVPVQFGKENNSFNILHKVVFA